MVKKNPDLCLQIQFIYLVTYRSYHNSTKLQLKIYVFLRCAFLKHLWMAQHFHNEDTDVAFLQNVFQHACWQYTYSWKFCYKNHKPTLCLHTHQRQGSWIDSLNLPALKKQSVLMISKNVLPQSFTSLHLFIAMWTLFLNFKVNFHVSSYIWFVFVGSIAQMTTPNFNSTFVHYKAHWLCYEIINFCKY